MCDKSQKDNQAYCNKNLYGYRQVGTGFSTIQSDLK